MPMDTPAHAGFSMANRTRASQLVRFGTQKSSSTSVQPLTSTVPSSSDNSTNGSPTTFVALTQNSYDRMCDDSDSTSPSASPTPPRGEHVSFDEKIQFFLNSVENVSDDMKCFFKNTILPKLQHNQKQLEEILNDYVQLDEHHARTMESLKPFLSDLQSQVVMVINHIGLDSTLVDNNGAIEQP